MLKLQGRKVYDMYDIIVRIICLDRMVFAFTDLLRVLLFFLDFGQSRRLATMYKSFGGHQHNLPWPFVQYFSSHFPGPEPASKELHPFARVRLSVWLAFPA